MKDMGSLKAQQQGFSLLSVVVTSLILTISFMFVSQILLQTQVIGNQQERFSQFTDLRDVMMNNLTSECAITNTIMDDVNPGLNCLHEGNCSPSEPMALTLKGVRDEVIYSPQESRYRLLTATGATCDPKLSQCVHGFDMTYTLKCADGAACNLPFALIEGKFYRVRPPSDDGEIITDANDIVNYNIYRLEKQMTYKRPYLSCQDVMDQGLAKSPPIQMASGIYRMDPDGQGGLCPFDVYCDLSVMSDGGGWALVGNQGLTTEALEERDPPLYKGMTGRLPDTHIQALLQKSNVGIGNNVRVQIDSRRARKHTLFFKVPPSSTIGEYTNAQKTCQPGDSTPIPTIFNGTGQFAFVTKSPGSEIGYKGRFYCTACDPNHINTVCTDMPNAGCCSDEQPVEGSIWVK